MSYKNVKIILHCKSWDQDNEYFIKDTKDIATSDPTLSAYADNLREVIEKLCCTNSALRDDKYGPFQADILMYSGKVSEKLLYDGSYDLLPYPWDGGSMIEAIFDVIGIIGPTAPYTVEHDIYASFDDF